MKKLKTPASLAYKLLELNVTKKRQPVFLCFYITNRCNLRCKYCFVVDESLDQKILMAEYTKEEVFHIVDEFYDMGTRMIYLLGGEPLIHKNIGEIIDYIVNKGILLHVITNGTLIERKIEEIRNADAICISLDGVGEVNDCLRGDRVYERAMSGLEMLKKTGMKARIHSVITRNNLHNIEDLAKVCQELDIPLSVSPPTYIGETDLEVLRISDEEYKQFWAKYKELKDQGYPISNTYDTIEIMKLWPIGYHQMMTYDTPLPPNYERPPRCVSGDIFCGLGAEGTLYYCAQLGTFNGPNIREVGIRKAWEILINERPNCLSCASINTVENSMALRLDMQTVWGGLKFHFLNK